MQVVCSNSYCGRPLPPEAQAWKNDTCLCSSACGRMTGVPQRVLDILAAREAAKAAQAAPAAAPGAEAPAPEGMTRVHRIR